MYRTANGTGDTARSKPHTGCFDSFFINQSSVLGFYHFNFVFAVSLIYFPQLFKIKSSV